MKFVKMHGLGNDYIYVDCFAEQLPEAQAGELARRLSHRNLGIGGDGLILIMPSDKADFRMRIFNSDGSEGGMCGNGLRCVAKYVYEHGLTTKTQFTIETRDRLVVPQLKLGASGVELITVDMEQPCLLAKEIPCLGEADKAVVDRPLTADGTTWHITAVSMGNPHCVIFCQQPLTSSQLQQVGSRLENDTFFPEKTNVEFITIVNRSEINFQVWERGAGATLACGSGACAAVVAAILNDLTDRQVLVHLPGGDLTVEWSADNGHVYMTGPATEVFSGEIAIDRC